MKIEIAKKSVHSLKFELLKDDNSKSKKTRQVKIKLENETYVNQKNQKAVMVRNLVEIEIERAAKIDIIYDFEYKLEEIFTETLAKSDEFKHITMSQAYPYIKSYVEQIATMSGAPSVALPYVDFATLPNRDVD
ncbi:hypothetical protein C5E18_11785 [Pectobacterium parmentieri]|uniref:protein-export chaperone SecB n=1 Tax=Pectobacterium parmentieri TaxID=1905730 RepID=UPI000F8F0A77|nr:protein-export chaperone SecB [Pectobacterium parmentieri]AZS56754.1 hypothetical protein C5E18_11785 [Pectobacterium parmentieri]